ncbi:hypothetical protein FSARC_14777 [Fusarium sarcochroum]|uniref:Nephrocystin 3-like N-terminal domain-containing protein n=1 Tax=Fusarium sarcochroum TaxID=1208366 RepID=A0A8H4SR91_9HYPO|nr:hypothetical protein FSARC_14777 [Fusarium sarcochroum]
MNLLSQIHRFAPVGDVVVGGVQNLAVSAAWGAIRLGIVVRTDIYWNIHEELSDMLLRISKTSQMSHEFITLFPNSLRLQIFVYQYLTLVVENSEKIVNYANKSLFGQMGKALIVDLEFKTLEQKGLDIAGRIDRCANQEATRMNQREHDITQRLLRKVISTISPVASKNDRRLMRKRRLLDSLDSNHANSRIITWRRLLDKGSSSWFTSLPKFNEWSCSLESTVPWLHGNLGSGKSVTLAWAIGALKRKERMSPEQAASLPRYSDISKSSKEDSCATNYYYCSPIGTDARSILASIAQQILKHKSLTDRLNTFLDKRELDYLTTEELHDYMGLVVPIVPKDWAAFIIWDGLGDCMWQDIEDVSLQL